MFTVLHAFSLITVLSLLPFPTTGRPQKYYPPTRLGSLAVYFGQNSLSADSSADSLTTLCSNPDIDIIVLGFVNTFFATASLPSMNLGPFCTQKQLSNDLLTCPALAEEIKVCQDKGKTVLVSIGGETAGEANSFPDDSAAERFADTLWSLFGDGSGHSEIRPFGDVVVDGFDLDNENKNSTGYLALIARLRTHFAESSREFIISAAPQCYRPEASLADAIYHVDYVFLQMYNNPSCEASATSGCSESLRLWSEDLAAHNEDIVLFPGFLGAEAAGGSGYVSGERVMEVMGEARGLRNVRGVMVWDASFGAHNMDAEGRSFLELAKEALVG